MGLITQTYGINQLQAQLTRFANQARKETKRRVLVGFSAPYAAAVHEKVDMVLEGLPRPSGIGVYWGPHGEAKFLEKPTKRLKKQIARRIAQVTKNTHSVTRGMYSGGVMLRDAAKALTPVEYGELRDSAYVVVV
jgi:hypothetical protein